jgi:hypothetical protein
MSEQDTEPVNIGDKAKDIVTGFQGIVVGKTSWLHGCDRLTLEPDKLDDEGQPQRVQTFDDHRIEIVQRGVLKPCPPEPNSIKLGDKVRDKVNGFKGIATGMGVWLSGNVNFTIEPDSLDKNGQPQESHAAEAHRLDLVEQKPVPVSPNAVAKATGGPQRGEASLMRGR